MKKILYSAVITCVLLGCTLGQDHDDIPKDMPIPVSIISLIATPERYHGQLVFLTGWVSIGYRTRAIYYSSERSRLDFGPDSIWLEFSEELTKTRKVDTYNGHYVMLKGVFDKDNHGEMGIYQGAITDIKHIEILDD